MPNLDVYFDNLQVTHVKGPLVEENHYYPYGLAMAGISNRALPQGAVNRFKANAGAELGSGEWADGSGLELYETPLRLYDAQIGRFTGIDILAETSFDLTPYHFCSNNPVMSVDPSGAKDEPNDESKNPAAFSSAAALLDYIMQHGIGGFGYEYMFWSFASSSGGSSAGSLASFRYSDNISYTAGGIYINWSGSYNDGSYGGFGKMTSLNTVIFGRTFLSAQNLWDGAMQYGEKHRNLSYGWFNGGQHRDVMWDHNYDVYRQRLNSGRPLQQPGDRASYTEQFGSLAGYYRGDQQGKMFYGGMVAIMAAPFAIEFLPLIAQGYTAASTGVNTANAFLTNIGIEGGIAINSLKNATVNAIGGAIVQYGPSSMIFSSSLFSMLNRGYGVTITDNTIYSVLKFVGGRTGIFPKGVALP